MRVGEVTKHGTGVQGKEWTKTGTARTTYSKIHGFQATKVEEALPSSFIDGLIPSWTPDEVSQKCKSGVYPFLLLQTAWTFGW